MKLEFYEVPRTVLENLYRALNTPKVEEFTEKELIENLDLLVTENPEFNEFTPDFERDFKNLQKAIKEGKQIILTSDVARFTGWQEDLCDAFPEVCFGDEMEGYAPVVKGNDCDFIEEPLSLEDKVDLILCILTKICTEDVKKLSAPKANPYKKNAPFVIIYEIMKNRNGPTKSITLEELNERSYQLNPAAYCTSPQVLKSRFNGLLAKHYKVKIKAIGDNNDLKTKVFLKGV